MVPLLVRNGAIVVRAGALATSACRDCCDPPPEARYVKAADCCFPTDTFWIGIGQRCADGSPLWTEGGPPRTFGSNGCATTLPNVVRTLAEILAEDPNAEIVFYAAGSEPECRSGCDDPACPDCPQCCVSGELEGCDGNGGVAPLCCEHGGTFRVNIGVSFSYLEKSRVWGYFQGGLDCPGQCFGWSGEAISASNTALVGISALFTCQPDGTYAVQCISAQRSGRSDVWRVDGPEHPPCFPPANGFVPIRTLVASQSVDEGCADLVPPGEFTARQFFPLTRAGVVGLLPDLIRATWDGSGIRDGGGLVRTACSGLLNDLVRIDRSWTTDPCEALLDGMGTLSGNEGFWSGAHDCDGGTYTMQNQFQDGRTTRNQFPPVPWQRFVSSATTLVQAQWSIERSGSPTCDPPQCGDGPQPLGVTLARAARPLRSAKGCGGCGKGEGL